MPKEDYPISPEEHFKILKELTEDGLLVQHKDNEHMFGITEKGMQQVIQFSEKNMKLFSLIQISVLRSLQKVQEGQVRGALKSLGGFFK